MIFIVRFLYPVLFGFCCGYVWFLSRKRSVFVPGDSMYPNTSKDFSVPTNLQILQIRLSKWKLLVKMKFLESFQNGCPQETNNLKGQRKNHL